MVLNLIKKPPEWEKIQTTNKMATKQLELLLLRSNNFNNSDFKLVLPNKYNAYSDPYLYSERLDVVIGKRLDIVIGKDVFVNENDWIICKAGFVLGVFQNDIEVINFISNINK